MHQPKNVMVGYFLHNPDIVRDKILATRTHRHWIPPSHIYISRHCANNKPLSTYLINVTLVLITKLYRSQKGLESQENKVKLPYFDTIMISGWRNIFMTRRFYSCPVCFFFYFNRVHHKVRNQNVLKNNQTKSFTGK